MVSQIDIREIWNRIGKKIDLFITYFPKTTLITTIALSTLAIFVTNLFCFFSSMVSLTVVYFYRLKIITSIRCYHQIQETEWGAPPHVREIIRNTVNQSISGSSTIQQLVRLIVFEIFPSLNRNLQEDYT